MRSFGTDELSGTGALKSSLGLQVDASSIRSVTCGSVLLEKFSSVRVCVTVNATMPSVSPWRLASVNGNVLRL